MSTPPLPGGPVPERSAAADILASDRERDDAATALREHCAAGRLTLEEFGARLDATTQARTRGDLARVLEDLPGGIGGSATPATSATSVVSAAPVPASRVTHRGWAVAMFDDAERSGRWNPGLRTGGVAVFGDAELDLRSAEVTGPVLDVEAWALFGDAIVIVPEGAIVEVSGVGVFGSTKVELEGDPQPGMPTIRVRSVPVFGDVRIRSTPRPPGYFARLFRRGHPQS